jgi:NAD(P)-dependent dehydrogenase (short-subunit alcohol dehydrogenase family)
MSDLFDLRKEIILITGASQGLGRRFARVLAAHGAAVVLAARQSAKLKSLEEEIRGKGGRAAAVQMDVTDVVSIGKAVDAAATPSGKKLTKRIPQRRVGAESDLDGAILLLASNASRYMTGSVVTVDGGFLLS